MKKHTYSGFALAGACAGAVNGLFGAGGGMILVPLLLMLTDLEDTEVFPTSMSIIAPICVVSLITTGLSMSIPWAEALPYLAGGAIGGCLAGIAGRKIPVRWLHRSFGILIIWGGVRYLCS